MEKKFLNKNQIWFLSIAITIVMAMIYLVVNLIKIHQGVEFSASGISRWWDIPAMGVAVFLVLSLNKQRHVWFLLILGLAGIGVFIFFYLFRLLHPIVGYVYLGLVALAGLEASKGEDIGRIVSFIFLGLTLGFGLVCGAGLTIAFFLLLLLTVAIRVLASSVTWRRLAERIKRRKRERGVVAKLASYPEWIPGYDVVRDRSFPDTITFSPGNYQVYYPEPKGETGSIFISQSDIQRRAISARLLDWLLVNQEYIPEKWQGIHLVFWGTIYQKDGLRYVRTLSWNKERGEFYSQMRELNRLFTERYPALLRKHLGE